MEYIHFYRVNFYNQAGPFIFSCTFQMCICSTKWRFRTHKSVFGRAYTFFNGQTETSSHIVQDLGATVAATNAAVKIMMIHGEIDWTHVHASWI